MKTVQKYKAINGKLFDKKSDCLKEDKVFRAIGKIMEQLHKLPEDDGCSFANGGGYYQYEKELIDKLRSDFLDLVIKNSTWEMTIEFAKAEKKGMRTNLGRIFDDGDSVFYQPYTRLFDHISKDYREYGQTYYANHPKEAKQVQLNK